MSKVESELRMISLKSKTNLIAALGGVWDLAAAKQRAARKSKIPLMVIALVSVSIFSSASIITLQMTLQESYREIARLEQSRNLVNEINLTQQSFLSMENAARLYFAALILFPSRIPERKKTFEFTGEALVGRLNRVEKATSSNKDWIRKFHKGKLRLISILEATKTSARTLEVQPTHSDMEMGMSMMNPANLRVSIQLSMMASEGINILQAMSHEGMKVEAEQHGQFKETTKWIRFLSPLSTILSGTLLLALVAYFAKGSPQSLRNMASKAALLRKQGLVSSSVSKDEVADLNKVFEELAQALNDAEEREKALLKQLQEQDRPNHE